MNDAPCKQTKNKHTNWACYCTVGCFFSKNTVYKCIFLSITTYLFVYTHFKKYIYTHFYYTFQSVIL